MLPIYIRLIFNRSVKRFQNPFRINVIHYNSLLKGSFVCLSTMPKPKLYITRPDVPEEGIAMLQDKFEIKMWPGKSPVPREELIKQVKGVDALFCYLTDKIDEQVLESAGPSLKVIGTMSVGYDHINVSQLKKKGIKLGITPDVLTDAVAELSVGLLLATSRRLFEAHQEILKAGSEPLSSSQFNVDSSVVCMTIRDRAGTGQRGQVGLQNSTVGVVGLGRIGQEIVKRLKPFKVTRFLYCGRSDKTEAREIGVSRVSLDELLAHSDFVIVTCALTPDTKEMFNDSLFEKMKSSAIFINVSRGGVVDQFALQRALESKRILAAGLDVMTPEPLPPKHPLLQLSNCVILPHIGSATIQARKDMALLTVKNIIAGVSGTPMPAPLC
uniref:Glyoxylate reductase/hydroxypyruvate reductase n=1 Tax=Timema douglasi TaxID=61478 RepID=A0A7R8VH18_TIMDO|nr:unnamed protein product [Timema douglasi]